MERIVNVAATIEAILFVAEEPLPEEELAALLEVPKQEVHEVLTSLAADLERAERGVVLRSIGGGWRLYTHPDTHEYVERFATSARASKLSRAALETLAVVAYRQPVSRGQVSEIRGVDSERSLHTLERRGLIEVIGIAPGAGQAVLYGTTPLLLEKLGVNAIDELPPLADHIPPAEVVEALERPFRPEPSSSASSD